MGKHEINEDSTRNLLKVILVLFILAVICISLYMTKLYTDGKKEVDVVTSNEEKTTMTVNQNEEQEKVEENVIEKEQEEETKEETEENIEEEKPVVAEETEEKGESNVSADMQETKQTGSTSEETNISDEDKAVQLAKKQFGTTDGVTFNIEQIQSNNLYIISVRDSENTGDLAWYIVDVKNGTVRDY